MPRNPTNPIPALLASRPVLLGLAVRLFLTFALPSLLDDGLLLQGVRYTDIDYDVFTDAADHVAEGGSPYERHTYRYTPFLAELLALPLGRTWDEIPIIGGLLGAVCSRRYFGKILFCVADVICGYLIVVLRRKSRQHEGKSNLARRTENSEEKGFAHLFDISPELEDALWWLYNPLPINICTRGSAESLVVLLPVLATVAVADMNHAQPSTGGKQQNGTLTIMAQACFAGILHGIGIHAKLYPVIYTVSFMANLSRQQQQIETQQNKMASGKSIQQMPSDVGWMRHLSSERFPWTHPRRIMTLALLWIQRLLFTMSSIMFLLSLICTVSILTYLAVHYHGNEALEEGLLYHFRRVDHRHNYSMYWYWIYLARGRAERATQMAASSSVWGFIPLIPQVLILGFSSLGIAPYDLNFALFCQTFAFVAFNKVITAQYFTWYLCLLPLCSHRVLWHSKRMYLSLGILVASIVTWLLSAFSLEMLGWRTHRQVWMASLFFFVANVNLLRSILMGYRRRNAEALSRRGNGWTKTKAS